jgi:hypothetical protein
MNYLTLVLTALMAVLVPLHAQAQARDPNHFNNVEDEAPWQESTYKLPPFPKDENLIEFYVGPTATAKYYIDQTSIGAGGNDNVVRYVIVIKTNGGATNISFEGLRCDSREFRLYATGRNDGTWVEPRSSEWRPLQALTLHKQQGALFVNYFCPNRLAIWTPKEGIDALKRGGHPDVTR